MTRRRQVLTAGLGMLGGSAGLHPARAQTYPSSPIRIFCGFPAGGGGDIIVRWLGDKLRERAGQPVVVDNRAGAMGNIAADAAAKARPDGYNLIMMPSTVAAGNAHLFKRPAFDILRDFEPLCTLCRLGFVLMVNPEKVPVSSVAELTAWLRARKGDATFGSPGTSALVCAELYKSRAGVGAFAVSYRGMAAALIDMANKQLDFLFVDAALALEPVRDGRFRALAVTTEDRVPFFPGVPSMAEAGVPGYAFDTWWAAYVPAGTPAPIAARLSGWLREIVALEETRSFLAGIGTEPMAHPPEQIRTLLQEDLQHWAELVRLAGIEPQ
ncbi:Bug family tripartite tricarboxylate transporter substrate binding protein [Roseomonas sp. BN140053]|uniref:Bug family tripartite tricarboxylate transporter substrate binding protein n=1 Tax=Roseomonas sp. BN140053 TaxID=3391898 RepID=UPI0039E7E9BA